MDDANRRGLEQAFHNIRFMVQNTQDHVQPGAGVRPEQYTFSPNPYPPDTRIFSPAQPPLNVQSQASASASAPAPQPLNVQSQVPAYTPQPLTSRGPTVFLPNGRISHNTTSTSQTGLPTMQRLYQPVQQQLGSRFAFQPSLNNPDPHAYQLNQTRHGAPHRQLARGPYQPRQYPYEAPQSRTPHVSSQSYSQNAFQAPLPNNPTSSTGQFYHPTQSHLPAIPQVQTASDQNYLASLHRLQSSQQGLPSQRSSPNGVVFSTRAPAQLHIHQTSQIVSAGGLPLSQPHIQGPVTSYGRIQTPTQNKSQAPLPSATIPRHPSQASPRPYHQNTGLSHGLAQPITQSAAKPITQSIAKPVAQGTPQVQSTPQTPLSNVSTSAHPSQPSPQSTPSPPRVLYPQLHTVTYAVIPLQAQPDNETNHPNQKKLIDAMQKHSLEKLRPHEFIDYLTMEHTSCFAPRVLRIYDVLFMQTLLFVRDHVLLVSPKQLETPSWAPPQSVLYTSDLSGFSPHAFIKEHMLKALNVVTDYQPDEIAFCEHHQRHDSAVNVVKNNGQLVHGWAVALSCEISPLFNGRLRPRLFSKELSTCFQTETQVRGLNMDPVWKAKVLEIFALRRSVRRNAQRESSLMNR
jgi:hypothetical protein